MSTDHDAVVKETAVPVPVAYNRHISYNIRKNDDHDPTIYTETKVDIVQVTEDKGLQQEGANAEHEEGRDAQTKSSVLIFLLDSVLYIRVLAILVMLISFSLILTAVVMFSKAQKKPGNPLDTVPKRAPITDHPCILFLGVAAMNFVLSTTILGLSCISTKFKKSWEAVNAYFAILSAIGFGTSMGACFYLNKQTKLQNDLWKWSCGNKQNGIVSDDINFGLVCHVVDYGWKAGLVQASLELLTFIVACVAFILLRYSLFIRYGHWGKFF